MSNNYQRPPMARRRRSASSGPNFLSKLPFPRLAQSERWLALLIVIFVSMALITTILTVMVVVDKWPDFFPENNSEVDPAAVVHTNGSVIPQSSEYTRSLKNQDDPDATVWDGNGRVTVLVMGLDSRDTEKGEPARTDSMILFSMDPSTHTAGMLSIPRDLWVNIPGYYEDKLNTAYFKGEADGLPGGGPGLTVKTVEELTGMPINYFAEIDFDAFVKFIDEIGGVDIKVREEMVIDPIGPGNTIFLKPGTQTFNGAVALAYARARDTAHGDFDRAQRQQQVIMAVRDNVLNYYSLPKLVLKAPAIYNDLASGVRTNMSLQDAVRMAWAVQQIKIDDIHRGVIQEPDQATATLNIVGQYVLIPDMEQIAVLRDQVFSSAPLEPTPQVAQADPAAGDTPEDVPVDSPVEEVLEPTATEVIEEPTPIPTPEPPKDPREAAKAERANVVILNGTSVVGLAARTHEFLMLKGIKVVEEGNSDNKLAYTELYVSTDKPDTISYLADLLKIPANRIFNQSASPDSQADITIILGSDWANENPMP
ncbi:MAG: LCP family protein [Anaerolineae bacterium]|nr:LCP family protein [Anaerolineae bacterium]